VAITPRKVSAKVYRRRRIAAALAAMVVLGLVALAGGWGYTAFRFGQISSVHVPGLGKTPSDGSVNLLVVGSDTRQGLRDGGFGDAAGQRSDVIILVHLVPAARHAAVLSIPRDLYVPVAGTGGSAKINSAFNHGPGQLVQTIQESLDIPIHHYLLVNFDGFREVVDALGGVSMYFPRPVRDDNNGRNESGLQVPRPGCRRLDGDQALALARSRYFQYQDKAGRWRGDPGTDLGRIRRQQTMLRALAANAVGRNLANPLRANALVGSVVHSLTKDDQLTIRRSVTLARQFRAFDPARLTTITVPVDRAVQHDGVVRRAGAAGVRRRPAPGLGADPAAQAARRHRRRGQVPHPPDAPDPTRPADHRPAPRAGPALPHLGGRPERHLPPGPGRPHRHRPAPPRVQGRQRRQRPAGSQDRALVRPGIHEGCHHRGPGDQGRPGGRAPPATRPGRHLGRPDPRQRFQGRGPPGQEAPRPDPPSQAHRGHPRPARLGPPPLLSWVRLRQRENCQRTWSLSGRTITVPRLGVQPSWTRNSRPPERTRNRRPVVR
jgi:LCP family protein required for cell wall assembly